MDIKINEFKKVITSPVIIGLLILFLVFNFIIILQNSYIKEDLSVLNNLVDKFGYKIDDKMIIDFKASYEKDLERLNEIVEEKQEKSYSSVSEFYEQNIHNIEENYSIENKSFINELGIIESYYYESLRINDVYLNYSIMERAEEEINNNKLGEKPAQIVRDEYKKLEKRFDKLISNNEHKNLFFMGRAYEMHSLLFKSFFKTIIFEIIILVVLITSYLVNYEFDNNTETIIYATKRGRGLVLDKLFVSIISNMLIVTTIFTVSLGLYFFIFNYRGLWSVPISSYFNTEEKFLYISWWNMSFIYYLFSSIGLVYALTLIFTGMTFIISMFIKNSYIVFFIFAILFGLFILSPQLLSRDSNLIFSGAFTPFILVLYSQLWFMESGAITTFKYYEIITVGIWGALVLASSILSIKKFRKKDI